MAGELKVLITGAAGQIAYSLIQIVSSGATFGADQKLHLVLLDLPFAAESLNGVEMELLDSAYPCVAAYTVTTDPKVAFADIDVAIMVGAAPRKDGQERADLLKINASIFKEQGILLNTIAKKTVKVLVVGNPANTNCLVAMKNAPSIPSENFTSLSRLDHNRLLSQIAQKAGCSITDVKQVAIWGNHSNTQYPDVSYAYIQKPDGTKKVTEAISDETWLKDTLVKTVQQRGAAVIKARKLSSATSAAKAISDHLRNWFSGSNGEWVSMGVLSDGRYGSAEDTIFSFPVVCTGGKYEIVKDLVIDEFSKNMIKVTADELLNERKLSADLF